MVERRAVRVRVTRFGGPEVLQFEEFTPGHPSRRKVRVRVTHASVGSTDAMARAGDYLLQPRPGFVPGYDFVGVLETADAAAERRGLAAGHTRDRVSGANGWLHEPTRRRLRSVGGGPGRARLGTGGRAAARPGDRGLGGRPRRSTQRCNDFRAGSIGRGGCSDHPSRDRRRHAGGRHRVGPHAGLRRSAGRPGGGLSGSDLAAARSGAGTRAVPMPPSTTPAARWCGPWSLPRGPWCALRGADVPGTGAWTPRSADSSRTSVGMPVHVNGCARCHSSSRCSRASTESSCTTASIE